MPKFGADVAHGRRQPHCSRTEVQARGSWHRTRRIAPERTIQNFVAVRCCRPSRPAVKRAGAMYGSLGPGHKSRASPAELFATPLDRCLDPTQFIGQLASRLMLLDAKRTRFFSKGLLPNSWLSALERPVPGRCRDAACTRAASLPAVLESRSRSRSAASRAPPGPCRGRQALCGRGHARWFPIPSWYSRAGKAESLRTLPRIAGRRPASVQQVV